MPLITKPLNDPEKLAAMVWDATEIDTKTELNNVQIESINKLQTLQFLSNSHLLKEHLDKFMRLQKSKDRRSIQEFVDVVKSKKTELLEKAGGFKMLG